jgi:hypothetical protein
VHFSVSRSGYTFLAQAGPISLKDSRDRIWGTPQPPTGKLAASFVPGPSGGRAVFSTRPSAPSTVVALALTRTLRARSAKRIAWSSSFPGWALVTR